MDTIPFKGLQSLFMCLAGFPGDLLYIYLDSHSCIVAILDLVYTANEDWVDEPLRKVYFLNRSAAQNPQKSHRAAKQFTDGRNQTRRHPMRVERAELAKLIGEKSKFVCENAVTGGGGTDWVDTGARRGWCLFGRGGNNLREPGPLNYLHNHCRRGRAARRSTPPVSRIRNRLNFLSVVRWDKQTYLQVPEPALVYSLSIIQTRESWLSAHSHGYGVLQLTPGCFATNTLFSPTAKHLKQQTLFTFKGWAVLIPCALPHAPACLDREVSYTLCTEGGLFGKAGVRFDTCAADICNSPSQRESEILCHACEPTALRSFTTEV
ncbi:unnamed protein product [Leuciscus chuanchicus]